MARTTYQVNITQIKALTPTIRELVIELPNRLSFKAGQFIMLHIPVPDRSPVKRAYSIASCEQNDQQLRLIIKLVPGGIASEFIRLLPIGDNLHQALEISGPFGKLLFNPPESEQIIFLCTGAGVSQHYSFLSSLTDNKQKLRMLFAVWNENEIFYTNELKKIKESLFDFDFSYILDHSLDGKWQGRLGYLTQYLDEFNYLKTPSTFYLCGNPAMIKSVKELLLNQGFAKERVFAEAFH